MLTPIYIDYNFFSPLPIQQPMPVGSGELNSITEPFITRPRFYLLVYPPVTNQIATIPYSPFKINIPYHPQIESKLRIRLAPTIGYGINSCYVVEYWQWTKPVVPATNTSSKITRTLVKKEHWLIPNQNRQHILNYSERETFSKAKLQERYIQTTTVTRAAIGNFDSLLSNPDVLEIIGIYSADRSTVYTDFTILDNSGYWKEIPVGNDTQEEMPLRVGIQWGNTAPLPEEEYLIEYVKPLEHLDILFEEYPSKGVFPPRYPYGYGTELNN